MSDALEGRYTLESMASERQITVGGVKIGGGAPVIVLRAPNVRVPGLALSVPVGRSQPFPHGEPSDLYTVSLRTGKAEQICPLAEEDPAALWSADGSALWVVGSRAIYSVDRDGRNFGIRHEPGGIAGAARPGK